MIPHRGAIDLVLCLCFTLALKHLPRELFEGAGVVEARESLHSGGEGSRVVAREHNHGVSGQKGEQRE